MTSVITKVLEIIIHQQIVPFLISTGYLNPTQHGFSSAVTPAVSAHITRGDKYGVYVGAVEEIMCVVYVSVTEGA